MKSDSELIEMHMPAIRKRVRIASTDFFYIDDRAFKVAYDKPYLQHRLPENDINQALPLSQKLLLLEDALTNQLYVKLFCGLGSHTLPWPRPLMQEREQFMHGLSAVNTSSNAPDLHWRIEKNLEGVEYAHKNGVSRPLTAGTFVEEKGSGGLVNFLRSAENRALEIDFYHAFSNTYLPEDQELYRIYWNIKPQAASVLLKALTERLNFYRVPFRFKCLNHPELYVRKDSAILFVNKNDLNLIKRLLRPILEEIRKYVNKQVPMFCNPFIDGTGLANDLGIDLSYGRYMMRLVAQRLIAEDSPVDFRQPDRAEADVSDQSESSISTITHT